jgi:hypothetical protein
MCAAAAVVKEGALTAAQSGAGDKYVGQWMRGRVNGSVILYQRNHTIWDEVWNMGTREGRVERRSAPDPPAGPSVRGAVLARLKEARAARIKAESAGAAVAAAAAAPPAAAPAVEPVAPPVLVAVKPEPVAAARAGEAKAADDDEEAAADDDDDEEQVQDGDDDDDDEEEEESDADEMQA